jgi:hypothetical protein
MKQAFTDEMAETPSEVGPIEREIGTISDLTNKLRLSLEKHEARIDAILRPNDVIAGERNSDASPPMSTLLSFLTSHSEALIKLNELVAQLTYRVEL